MKYREGILRSGKNWNKNNFEKRKLYKHRWYLKNKEHALSYQRDYDYKKYMRTIKEKPGYKIFKTDPKKYETVIRAYFIEKSANQLLAIYRDDIPIKELAKRDGHIDVTGYYQKMLVAEKLIIKNQHIELKDIPLTTTNGTPIRQSNLAKRLKKEEYDQIKDMLYKGETLDDIQRDLGKSYTTVLRVKNATSYEDYFKQNNEKTRRIYRKQHQKESKVNKTTSTGTAVTFHHPLGKEGASHRQALADAIDVFIEAEVKIRVQEKLDAIKASL